LKRFRNVCFVTFDGVRVPRRLGVIFDRERRELNYRVVLIRQVPYVLFFHHLKQTNNISFICRISACCFEQQLVIDVLVLQWRLASIVLHWLVRWTGWTLSQSLCHDDSTVNT